MRILTLCIVGLALMTAGCASRSTTSSAPAATAAPSGAATTTSTAGDRIDQWAAAVERQAGMKR